MTDDWDEFTPEEVGRIVQGMKDAQEGRSFRLKFFLGHLWAIRNKNWPKDGLERPTKISLTAGPLFNLFRRKKT